MKINKSDISAFKKWLAKRRHLLLLKETNEGRYGEQLLFLGFEYGTLRERKKWYRMRKALVERVLKLRKTRGVSTQDGVKAILASLKGSKKQY